MRPTMTRDAAKATAPLSAMKRTERVMHSLTTVVVIPVEISREMLAPRPTEGHNGVSKVASGTSTSS